MSYVSPERQRIARLNELGAKVDKFNEANGTQPQVYPVRFTHDQPHPIEIMSEPPPGHPAGLSYFDDGYTSGVPDEGYGQQQAAPGVPPQPMLKPINIADLFTNPSPPPLCVWNGYTPRGVMTLLGAHGGTGKSTIALMLSVCAVLGRPLFGVETEPCKVLFVSLEDDSTVVRHRLSSLCKAWLIDPEQLIKGLQIVDGREHPELFTAETRGTGQVTRTFNELHALVEAGNIGLVVIDNASDAFGGDEIQRRQVRAFMRELGKIAVLNNSALVLLAHVDKNTSRATKPENSEGYSGSTAWHNSARSRLFLTRGKDDLLTLEHQKNNLGRKRDPITLQWLEGGFPQLVAGYEAPAGVLAQAARSDDQNAQAILRMIAEFESRGQFCSPAPKATTNVNAMLRPEPIFKALKLSQDDTQRIVNQCQRVNWIEVMEYRSDQRKNQKRWTVTATGREFAGLPALSALSAPTYQKSAESAESASVPEVGALSAPTYGQGVRGGERTDVSAPPDAETQPAQPAKNKPTKPSEEF